jgi:hypothetical protein
MCRESAVSFLRLHLVLVNRKALKMARLEVKWDLEDWDTNGRQNKPYN